MTDEELADRFKHHAPKNLDTSERHGAIRGECLQLAKTVRDLVPIGREQSLALTKLEEVMFWANAGIARNT